MVRMDENMPFLLQYESCIGYFDYLRRLGVGFLQ
jgi:hypothetical protein